MRHFESVNLRVITQPLDDVVKIRDLFHSLLPVDWEKEKIALSESSFTDAHEDERFILELQLTKQRHVNVFSKHLIAQFSDELKQQIKSEAAKQVDESSHFFVRFDLDALLEDEWRFTLDGRCLHINMAVCAHPRRQSVAIGVVESYLSQ